jgi:hypothetical protein
MRYDILDPEHCRYVVHTGLTSQVSRLPLMLCDSQERMDLRVAACNKRLGTAGMASQTCRNTGRMCV